MPQATNTFISQRLNEYSDILAQQEASQFRVAAYRRAANTVENLVGEVGELYRRGGTEALVALPNIGTGIASGIVEMLRTGRFTRLERLRGELEPAKLFDTLPGVGPELAQRIHDELDIDTLEELEIAAHDGRLESVHGIGDGRARIIRAGLNAILSRPRPGPPPDRTTGPGVGELLTVDGEYRDKAARGELPTIAPKRFNPQGAAWLPIMHSAMDGRHYTVVFSNTARAHELNRTRDWVVIFFYDDHHQEGQHTVVTETHGPLKGKRVVRGRELECTEYYERKSV